MSRIKIFEEYNEEEDYNEEDYNDVQKIDISTEYGYALGEVHTDGYCELKIVHVHPNHQGKGYGKKLIADFINAVKDAGYSNYVEIEVESVLDGRFSTEELFKFYQKLGFVKTYHNRMKKNIWK